MDKKWYNVIFITMAFHLQAASSIEWHCFPHTKHSALWKGKAIIQINSSHAFFNQPAAHSYICSIQPPDNLKKCNQLISKHIIFWIRLCWMWNIIKIWNGRGALRGYGTADPDDIEILPGNCVKKHWLWSTQQKCNDGNAYCNIYIQQKKSAKTGVGFLPQ